jgi:hypothetical protein
MRGTLAVTLPNCMLVSLHALLIGTSVVRHVLAIIPSLPPRIVVCLTTNSSPGAQGIGPLRGARTDVSGLLEISQKAH